MKQVSGTTLTLIRPRECVTLVAHENVSLCRCWLTDLSRDSGSLLNPEIHDALEVTVRPELQGREIASLGIPGDQLAQVFEPFFQVESGPTRRYPGIGLGLAIARDLARAMGARFA